MALIDRTNRETAIEVLGEITNRINAINLALKHADGEAANGVVLDAAFIASRNAAAIALGQEIVGLARWFMEDANQLNQTPQAAYDDAAVDAIRDTIRRKSDGNP